MVSQTEHKLELPWDLLLGSQMEHRLAPLLGLL